MREAAALGPRPEPLEGRALVDERLRDPERLAIELLVVLGVRDGAGDDLVDVLAGGVLVEPEHVERLGGSRAADDVDDPTRLAGTHPQVAGGRPGDLRLVDRGLGGDAGGLRVSHGATSGLPSRDP